MWIHVRSISRKLRRPWNIVFITVARRQVCLFSGDWVCGEMPRERERKSNPMYYIVLQKEHSSARYVFRSSGRCYGYHKKQAWKQGWLLRPLDQFIFPPCIVIILMITYLDTQNAYTYLCKIFRERSLILVSNRWTAPSDLSNSSYISAQLVIYNPHI
jgi:hypothetical protein